MKEMKLIMENFRKNMKEAFPGFAGRKLSDDEMGKLDPKMRGFIEKSRKSREDAANDIEMEKKRLTDNPQSPAEQAMGGAIMELEKRYGPDIVRAMHEMSYDDQETAIQNAFEDNHPEEAIVSREQIETIRRLLKISDPDEDYKQNDEDLPSDMEDPPGPMPGEGGNY
tara:strand:- start:133 stop:636 length:504 start_codon:yes stop_codon:yes gene_type:complete